jgi:archaellum component FlaC
LENLQNQFKTKNFAEDFDEKLENLEKQIANLKIHEEYQNILQNVTEVEKEIIPLKEHYQKAKKGIKEEVAELQQKISNTVDIPTKVMNDVEQYLTKHPRPPQVAQGIKKSADNILEIAKKRPIIQKLLS